MARGNTRDTAAAATHREDRAYAAGPSDQWQTDAGGDHLRRGITAIANRVRAR
jgi:hypothetical protein